MLHFLHALIGVDAVVTLAIWIFFLFSLVIGGFAGVRTGLYGTPANADAPGRSRAYGSLIPFLFFLIVTVVAFIAWCSIVFA